MLVCSSYRPGTICYRHYRHYMRYRHYRQCREEKRDNGLPTFLAPSNSIGSSQRLVRCCRGNH